MTAIDLLADGGAEAKTVLARSKPAMTKGQYLRLQEQRSTEEVFSGLLGEEPRGTGGRA